MKTGYNGDMTEERVSSYNSVIVFLNRRCLVGCRTCNVKALPDLDEEIGEKRILEIVDSLRDVTFSGYIVWTGGEPFLSFKSLHRGIARAAKLGFQSEILSSGLWHHHAEKLSALSAAANFSLRLSLDFEHQLSAHLEDIFDLIDTALALSIEVNFTYRALPGREGDFEQYMGRLQRFFPRFYEENHRRSRWIHRIPHIPVDNTDPYTPQSSAGILSSSDRCGSVLKDLVYGPDGSMYPCCGIFSLSGFERFQLDMEQGAASCPHDRADLKSFFNDIGQKGVNGTAEKHRLKTEKTPGKSICMSCLELLDKLNTRP